MSVSTSASTETKIDKAVKKVVVVTGILITLSVIAGYYSWQAFTGSLSLVGQVTPQEVRYLRAECNSVISRVWVQPGDWVDKGQALVEIDSWELARELRVAKTTVQEGELWLQEVEIKSVMEQELLIDKLATQEVELNWAKSDLELVQNGYNATSIRDEQKMKQGIAQLEMAVRTSRQAIEMQSKRSLVEQQKARDQLERKQYDLAWLQERNNLRIASPYRGQVLEVFVVEAQEIKPQTQLLSIADRSSLRVVASLPASNVEQVEIGHQVEVTIGSNTYPGWVSFLSPLVKWSGNQSSIEIHIEFDNALEDVLVGSQALVKIPLH